jgi:hypothetical protein
LLLAGTAIARMKCASAFGASGSGNISAISPATRWTSASHHFSLVVSAARFFAWIGRNRRLAKDFEATIDSARAFLYAASVMLLVVGSLVLHNFRPTHKIAKN